MGRGGGERGKGRDKQGWMKGGRDTGREKWSEGGKEGGGMERKKMHA